MKVTEQKLRGVIREAISEILSEDASREAHELIRNIDMMQDDLFSLQRSAPREYKRDLDKAQDHLDEIYNIVSAINNSL